MQFCQGVTDASVRLTVNPPLPPALHMLRADAVGSQRDVLVPQWHCGVGLRC